MHHKNMIILLNQQTNLSKHNKIRHDHGTCMMIIRQTTINRKRKMLKIGKNLGDNKCLSSKVYHLK